jgi:hypothetical protein
VDALEATLRDMKKKLEPAPPPPRSDQSFTIFLAHTEGSLRDASTRVIAELGQNGVQVATDMPPPYPAKEHEQQVTAAIQKANLSVHLLDGSPGIPVQGEAGRTYCQKQVEIGKQHAQSQLIWIPKTLDLQTIENSGHREFLNQLAHGNREQSAYSLIEGLSASLTREILEKINQIKAAKDQPRPSLAGLLDTHLKDKRHALDLSEILLAREMRESRCPPTRTGLCPCPGRAKREIGQAIA